MKQKTQAQKNTIDMALRDMIAAVESLKSVYVRENAALESADTNIFMALQQEKLNAAQKYQSMARELMNRKDEMKSASLVLKQRLLEIERDFAGYAEKNLDFIARMQRSTERLGGMIMDAAKEALKKTRAVAYGDNGIMRSDERRIVSTGMIETA
jgi:hypothetical protein